VVPQLAKYVYEHFYNSSPSPYYLCRKSLFETTDIVLRQVGPEKVKKKKPVPQEDQLQDNEEDEQKEDVKDLVNAPVAMTSLYSAVGSMLRNNKPEDIANFATVMIFSVCVCVCVCVGSTM
jgi:hypothetical protein